MSDYGSDDGIDENYMRAMLDNDHSAVSQAAWTPTTPAGVNPLAEYQAQLRVMTFDEVYDWVRVNGASTVRDNLPSSDRTSYNTFETNYRRNVEATAAEAQRTVRHYADRANSDYGLTARQAEAYNTALSNQNATFSRTEALATFIAARPRLVNSVNNNIANASNQASSRSQQQSSGRSR
jgi:hypothetical protein